jgi:8-oxo-dGTP pyrophosphatase MutT (NUDIX family)
VEGAPARGETAYVSVVRAAGGIPVRMGSDGLEILLVHRPRYDDWTFPKGKCEPDETDESCALREVEEETGLVCALEDELPSTSYVDGHGRDKRVRYWRLRAVDGELTYAYEVDQARWVPVEEAATMLTYERDLAVLGALRPQEQVSG